MSPATTLLVNLELDPPIGDVVLPFEEPVVAGIELADYHILNGVADEVVVGLDQRSQRGENRLSSMGIVVPLGSPCRRISPTRLCGIEAVDDEQHPVETIRSEEHTSELQSRQYLVCRLLL